MARWKRPLCGWVVSKCYHFRIDEGTYASSPQVQLHPSIYCQGNKLRDDFIEALEEISGLMSNAYEQFDPVPGDHPLAQAGLRNGAEIVLDYLDHNEAGVAFDHLFYMINEPPLIISERCRAVLVRISSVLGIPLTLDHNSCFSRRDDR